MKIVGLGKNLEILFEYILNMHGTHPSAPEKCPASGSSCQTPACEMEVVESPDANRRGDPNLNQLTSHWHLGPRRRV